MVSKIKRLSRLASPNPFSPEEISKHVDSFLRRDLLKIQVDVITERQLTIVFWDISEFSKMCNLLSQCQGHMVYFFNPYFLKAVRIVRKYRGVLDKFIGDGILAYFGYNNLGGNGAPKSAINAALEFKREFNKISKCFRKFCLDNNGNQISDINLKCGVHNGPAYLSLFGSQNRNSLNIYGPTVNFASRLESFAKNDEIIVSSTVRNMVRERFRFLEIPVTDRIENGIKGFENEEFVYSVTQKI